MAARAAAAAITCEDRPLCWQKPTGRGGGQAFVRWKPIGWGGWQAFVRWKLIGRGGVAATARHGSGRGVPRASALEWAGEDMKGVRAGPARTGDLVAVRIQVKGRRSWDHVC